MSTLKNLIREALQQCEQDEFNRLEKDAPKRLERFQLLLEAAIAISRDGEISPELRARIEAVGMDVDDVLKLIEKWDADDSEEFTPELRAEMEDQGIDFARARERIRETVRNHRHLKEGDVLSPEASERIWARLEAAMDVAKHKEG